MEQSKDSEQSRKIRDILNWAKSELSQEQNPKLGKTMSPYRTEKIRFLNRIIDLLDY